jgi:phosphoribosylformylglycinamidine synthase
LIFNNQINACHDVSDGGILVAIFEMCQNFGFEFEKEFLKQNQKNLKDILFGEDQSRYIFACKKEEANKIKKIASEKGLELSEIGKSTSNKKIKLSNLESDLKELKNSL